MILFALSMPGNAPAAENCWILPFSPIGQGITTRILGSCCSDFAELSRGPDFQVPFLFDTLRLTG
jgi:hypothetical protein